MTGIFNRYSTLGKILKWTLVSAVLVFLIWYVVFQARFVIAGPSIVLTDEPSAVQHTPTVNIVGTAENVTLITLNGRPIFTDNSGNFRELLVLQNGYTIMTITAKDRFGRETTLRRSFVYLPQT